MGFTVTPLTFIAIFIASVLAIIIVAVAIFWSARGSFHQGSMSLGAAFVISTAITLVPLCSLTEWSPQLVFYFSSIHGLLVVGVYEQIGRALALRERGIFVILVTIALASCFFGLLAALMLVGLAPFLLLGSVVYGFARFYEPDGRTKNGTGSPSASAPVDPCV